MQSSRPRPHYTSLKTELNTLATSLARTIDAHANEPGPVARLARTLATRSGRV